MVKEFHSLHTERGEIFMEILKYDCKIKTGKVCSICEKSGWRGPIVSRVPRPYPGRSLLGGSSNTHTRAFNHGWKSYLKTET